ncbi:MAG: sulfatase-like hydrolase/transferase, partial [Verrucomicrobiae bacterium]|nr:sulfatase-like hydrolase/transferase [Verrucomicrobiae bacterium]
EENRDRPFFLYLAHYAVHTPIMAKPELVNNYSAKAPDKLRGQSDPEYAAMIESVDDSVGAILESLKRLNLDDNTIVVFTSDNGGARHYSNYPWRGEKGNFYEGGIRVPAIVKWPGRIPSGVTIDAVIISPDFYPTLLDLAGLPLRPNQHLDGLSLTELLTNGVPLQREAVFWHFPHYINKNIDMRFPTSTIRKGDWKLVEYLEDGHIELYNLSKDPGETSDLARSSLDKAEELRADLVDFRIRTQAQSLRPR